MINRKLCSLIGVAGIVVSVAYPLPSLASPYIAGWRDGYNLYITEVNLDNEFMESGQYIALNASGPNGSRTSLSFYTDNYALVGTMDCLGFSGQHEYNSNTIQGLPQNDPRRLQYFQEVASGVLQTCISSEPFILMPPYTINYVSMNYWDGIGTGGWSVLKAPVTFGPALPAVECNATIESQPDFGVVLPTSSNTTSGYVMVTCNGIQKISVSINNSKPIPIEDGGVIELAYTENVEVEPNIPEKIPVQANMTSAPNAPGVYSWNAVVRIDYK